MKKKMVSTKARYVRAVKILTAGIFTGLCVVLILFFRYYPLQESFMLRYGFSAQKCSLSRFGLHCKDVVWEKEMSGGGSVIVLADSVFIRPGSNKLWGLDLYMSPRITVSGNMGGLLKGNEDRTLSAFTLPSIRVIFSGAAIAIRNYLQINNIYGVCSFNGDSAAADLKGMVQDTGVVRIALDKGPAGSHMSVTAKKIKVLDSDFETAGIQLPSFLDADSMEADIAYTLVNDNTNLNIRFEEGTGTVYGTYPFNKAQGTYSLNSDGCFTVQGDGIVDYKGYTGQVLFTSTSVREGSLTEVSGENIYMDDSFVRRFSRLDDTLSFSGPFNFEGVFPSEKGRSKNVTFSSPSAIIRYGPLQAENSEVEGAAGKDSVVVHILNGGFAQGSLTGTAAVFGSSMDGTQTCQYTFNLTGAKMGLLQEMMPGGRKGGEGLLSGNITGTQAGAVHEAKGSVIIKDPGVLKHDIAVLVLDIFGYTRGLSSIKADFLYRDGVVVFNEIQAVGTNMVLYGTGTYNRVEDRFDLVFTARIPKKDIPVVDIITDMASDIVGNVFKQMLAVKVTGSLAEPKVTKTPVPAVFDSIAPFFGRLLNPAGNSHDN